MAGACRGFFIGDGASCESCRYLEPAFLLPDRAAEYDLSGAGSQSAQCRDYPRCPEVAEAWQTYGPEPPGLYKLQPSESIYYPEDVQGALYTERAEAGVRRDIGDLFLPKCKNQELFAE